MYYGTCTAMLLYDSLVQDGKFPNALADMVGLRWLRLNRTGLEVLPSNVAKLNKLVSF